MIFSSACTLKLGKTGKFPIAICVYVGVGSFFSRYEEKGELVKMLVANVMFKLGSRETKNMCVWRRTNTESGYLDARDEY